jgi:N-acetylmuramoyl-L-alanine amidase
MTVLASPSTTTGASAPVQGATQACNLKRVIVIDPGHGGTADVSASAHNHAVSHSGVEERALTLEYGLSLRTQLQSAEVQAILRARNICDLQVVMTRSTDVNVTGADRVAVGTASKADLFLSIHFNGSSNRSFRQIEGYYRAATNSHQTNVAEDIQFATVIKDAAAQGMHTFDSGARAPGRARPDTSSKAGMLWVLRDPGIGLSGTMCRSALLELEYITNPVVEQMLITGADRAAHRDTIMLAVARAMARTV